MLWRRCVAAVKALAPRRSASHGKAPGYGDIYIRLQGEEGVGQEGMARRLYMAHIYVGFCFRCTYAVRRLRHGAHRLCHSSTVICCCCRYLFRPYSCQRGCQLRQLACTPSWLPHISRTSCQVYAAPSSYCLVSSISAH